MTEISFEITRWDADGRVGDQPLFAPAPDGPALARIQLGKRYTGALEADAVGEVLTCGQQGYLAMERVSGTLAGRRGTFVLQHGATDHPDGSPRQFGWVVPGSGTGELTGLAGEARVDHGRLRLDWTLNG